MKTAIITIIVALIFLSFMFCNPTAHEVGIAQGAGDGVPLDNLKNVESNDSDGSTANVPGNGIVPVQGKKQEQEASKAIILIVSLDNKETCNAMNTISILCFKNGQEWYGTATGWTRDRHSLYYKATISLDFKTISVKEFIFEEETNAHLYVLEFISI